VRTPYKPDGQQSGKVSLQGKHGEPMMHIYDNQEAFWQFESHGKMLEYYQSKDFKQEAKEELGVFWPILERHWDNLPKRVNDIITMSAPLLKKKDEGATLIIAVDENYDLSVSLQFSPEHEKDSIMYNTETGKWTNLTGTEELPIYMDC